MTLTSLREWLDSQELQEETIVVRGKQLLAVEIDLAERGRLLAEFQAKGELTTQMIEGIMLARCVLDPETREQIVPCEEWKAWNKSGSSFGYLLQRVLVMNGLKQDFVEDELKNSSTTQA